MGTLRIEITSSIPKYIYYSGSAVSILIYALFGWSNVWYLRLGLRLLLLPIIAGLAYEVLRAAGKYDNWFIRAISAPGMALQRLTTRQPDDDMVEVAVVALTAALNETSDEELDALCEKFARPAPEQQEA